MMTFTFEVRGPPVGYTIQLGRFANNKRKRKYVEFKKKVQEVAAGVIPLPLEADSDHPILIETVAYFEHGTHPDPENVHKGVKDALFYGAEGAGDKYTGGTYTPPKYDRTCPRVEVKVTLL